MYEERLRSWKDTCARLARDEGGDGAPASSQAEDAQEDEPGGAAGPSQPQQHVDAGYVPFTQAEQSQLDGTHRKPLYEGTRLRPEAVEQLRTAVRQGHTGREGPFDPVVPDSNETGHGPHTGDVPPDPAPAAAAAAQPADSAKPEQTRRSARLASAGQTAAEPEQAEQPRSNRGSGRWFPTVFTNAYNSLTSSFRSTPPAAASAGPQQDEVVSQLTSETEGTSSDAVPAASPTRRQPPRAAKAAASQRLAAVTSDRHDLRAQAQTPPRSQLGAAASEARAGGGRGRPLAPRRRAAPALSEAAADDFSDEGAHHPLHKCAGIVTMHLADAEVAWLALTPSTPHPLSEVLLSTLVLSHVYSAVASAFCCSKMNRCDPNH